MIHTALIGRCVELKLNVLKTDCSVDFLSRMMKIISEQNGCVLYLLVDKHTYFVCLVGYLI